jgi:hypothetical protein
VASFPGNDWVLHNVVSMAESTFSVFFTQVPLFVLQFIKKKVHKESNLKL